LNIFTDESNYLRCAGRFKHAPLSEEEKLPILLPEMSKSRFTYLLVVHLYELNFHVGTQQTLVAVRRQYWLPRARNSIFHMIKKCVPCQRYGSRPYQQPEHSDLPSFRMQQGHLQTKELPFTHIGIDVFGPFYIETNKKWVLIII